MSEEKYISLAKDLYGLIIFEMKDIQNRNIDISTTYPKLVIMYEFFRMIRGEAFLNSRPPTPNFQNDLYKMQADIESSLDQIKSTIDFSDEKLQFKIKQVGFPYFEKQSKQN